MFLKNKRTWSFIFWAILLTVMIVVMPDLQKLTVEKGQVTIPDGSESVLGSTYLDELNTEGAATYTYALVFHQEERLTAQEYASIEAALKSIQADKALDIKDHLFHTESEQAASQLISEDETTVIAQVSIAKEGKLAGDIAQLLRQHLQAVEVDTYVTGSDLVISDFADSTQEGVKKTEIIAIVFILVILIIIFKSPVVPFVSLATVGISYVISIAIIALLVEHFDFPFSNFTQVFLVVVLFGVGTDYNILLFTRFKEEVAKQGNIIKAIATTYSTAGKTVVYSGLAVFVGFVALYLAQFTIYQATSAVAIGVAVLLAVLLTLNPFFMWIFGFKMFWPAKEVKGHRENKLWGRLSNAGFLRPFVSILFVLAATVPFIYMYSNTLNYNDLVEIDDKYESKQAIQVIEQHFDAGFSAPVSLVVKGEDLATTANLAELDKLAHTIEQIDGVAKVYSVTRPEGAKIPELYVDHQAGTMQEGLTEANDGVEEISFGLNDAKDEVSKPQDMSGIQELIDGTTALQTGATQLQQSLNTLQTGVAASANGAGELQAGASTLAAKTAELAQGLQQLTTSYEQLANGYSQFSAVFDQSIQGLLGAKQGYEQIAALLTAATATNDAQEIQTALQIAIGAQAQIDEAVAQLTGAKEQYVALTANLNQANEAIASATAGATQLQQGANTLAAGTGELQAGLTEAANGSGQIAGASGQLTTGLRDVHAGQQQVKDSLEDLQDQMNLLADGLGESTDGLDEIYDGLDEANRYLAELNQQQEAAFFIPQEVLEGEEFAESLDTYMNEAQSLTSMRIILAINPYTEEAMHVVKEIQDAKDGFMKSTTMTSAESYLTGKSMQNVDLQTVSQADFKRSAVVMVAGILLILLVVTKSAFQTAIIIGSLLLTNFAALGLTELFAIHVLGHEALSWNVPFFTLIMIITLGVDYSIFIMMRYNESKDADLTQIISTSKEMGGVIISAAVILGGTFAALIPSGIITLIQVAIAVMIGLVLLSVIVMPIFIPACFGLIYKWQNRKNK